MKSLWSAIVDDVNHLGFRLLMSFFVFGWFCLGTVCLLLKNESEILASRSLLPQSPITLFVGNNTGHFEGRSSPSQQRQPQQHGQIRYQYPIVFMGLPNSGSLQLHQYFQCRGLISRHYCCGAVLHSRGSDSNQNDHSALGVGFPCAALANAPSTVTGTARGSCGECVLANMKGGNDPFKGCHNNLEDVQLWASFDLETRDEWFLPQHFAVGLLHQAYPNATWILNKRSSSKAWAESILHWHSKTRRFFASYGLSLHPHSVAEPPNPNSHATTQQVLDDMQRVLEERLYNRTDHLRKLAWLQQIYDNHTSMIRSWSRQFPSHHMIEINVDIAQNDLQPVLENLLTGVADKKGRANPAISGSALKEQCPWRGRESWGDQDWADFQLPIF